MADREVINEVSLHDSRKQMGRRAGVMLLLAAVSAIANAAGQRHWYFFAVSAFIGLLGGTLAAITIRYPWRLMLSRTGLTYTHRHTAERIPAEAITALGITKVRKMRYLTLWYDTAVLPELPPEFASYAKRQAPSSAGVVYVTPVEPWLKDEQIQTIHRFVQQESLGEWRDYPAADVGSDG